MELIFFFIPSSLEQNIHCTLRYFHSLTLQNTVTVLMLIVSTYCPSNCVAQSICQVHRFSSLSSLIHQRLPCHLINQSILKTNGETEN